MKPVIKRLKQACDDSTKGMLAGQPKAYVFTSDIEYLLKAVEEITSLTQLKCVIQLEKMAKQYEDDGESYEAVTTLRRAAEEIRRADL